MRHSARVRCSYASKFSIVGYGSVPNLIDDVWQRYTVRKRRGHSTWHAYVDIDAALDPHDGLSTVPWGDTALAAAAACVLRCRIHIVLSWHLRRRCPVTEPAITTLIPRGLGLRDLNDVYIGYMA